MEGGQRTRRPGHFDPANGGWPSDDVAIIAAIRGDWVSSAAYQGRDIYSRAGVRLGTVADLVIAPDGRVVAAVIDVEHSLGIGHKDVAVPFSVL